MQFAFVLGSGARQYAFDILINGTVVLTICERFAIVLCIVTCSVLWLRVRVDMHALCIMYVRADFVIIELCFEKSFRRS